MRYGHCICLECLRTFDQPDRWMESHGLDDPSYEKFSGCPYCGGAYSKTLFCGACGEPITGDYVLIPSSGVCYCENCYQLRTLGDNDFWEVSEE